MRSDRASAHFESSPNPLTFHEKIDVVALHIETVQPPGHYMTRPNETFNETNAAVERVFPKATPKGSGLT